MTLAATASAPPGPGLPPWATAFDAFSLLHALTAGLLVFAMLAAIILGRRWRGTEREKILRAHWAWFTILWQIGAIVWWLLPSNFDLSVSLPLQLCDLAVWIAPFALLTQNRTLRALLFFWGLGLSTQAFVSPIVDGGINTVEFWLFWVGHTQIIGSAAYDSAVLGFRPKARDFIIVSGISIAAALAMLGFDLATGTNYWYVGNSSPDKPTIVDLLGPWPLRVVWIMLLGLAVMAALWGLFAAAGHVPPRSQRSSQ
jgi:hypothetical integral membrane protein (TIGR02206 family)